MCDCEDDGLDVADDRIPLTSAMVTRMLSLEQALEGTRVPARSWSVFLGRESGGIPFDQLLRIHHCRQVVTDEERRARRMFVRARGRRKAAPVCLEAV